MKKSINECKFNTNAENIKQVMLRLENKRDKIISMKIDGTIEGDGDKMKYVEFENKVVVDKLLNKIDYIYGIEIYVVVGEVIHMK